LPVQHGLISKIRKKIYNILDKDETVKKTIGELLFWSSNRGRKFPIKSWDDPYFHLLADSEFVLCPAGDFDWSYRFFESMLCGAIPIAEVGCSVYNGFKYYTFSDLAGNLAWSEEFAIHNYNLCLERLTIPKDQLNNELEKLLMVGRV
jgi:hypothetical protein